MAQLRRLWLYSPMRKESLRRASTELGVLCLGCGLFFNKYEVHIDHVSPVISIDNEENSWDSVIERLFYGETQVLCHKCHQKKSSAENKRRRIKTTN